MTTETIIASTIEDCVIEKYNEIFCIGLVYRAVVMNVSVLSSFCQHVLPFP